METEVPQDGHGLNKAARLKAVREEEERLQVPPPLDPDFPFRVLPFDPKYFSASVDLTLDE